MLITLRKFLFIATFNFTLFLLLIIGIQNSSSKRKINLITGETVKLPISFIVGISFISGSVAGSLLTMNLGNKKQ